MTPSKAARAWTRSLARAAMIIFMVAGAPTGSLATMTKTTSSVRTVMTSCMAETAMISLMAVRGVTGSMAERAWIHSWVDRMGTG